MNKTIDVLYPTYGTQAGVQAQFNPYTNTWTVWTKLGTCRTFNTVTAFARYMNEG